MRRAIFSKLGKILRCAIFHKNTTLAVGLTRTILRIEKTAEDLLPEDRKFPKSYPPIRYSKRIQFPHISFD